MPSEEQFQPGGINPEGFSCFPYPWDYNDITCMEVGSGESTRIRHLVLILETKSVVVEVLGIVTVGCQVASGHSYSQV